MQRVFSVPFLTIAVLAGSTLLDRTNAQAPAHATREGQSVGASYGAPGGLSLRFDYSADPRRAVLEITGGQGVGPVMLLFGLQPAHYVLPCQGTLLVNSIFTLPLNFSHSGAMELEVPPVLPEFYMQAIAFAPACGLAGLLTSNGLRMGRPEGEQGTN